MNVQGPSFSGPSPLPWGPQVGRQPQLVPGDTVSGSCLPWPSHDPQLLGRHGSSYTQRLDYKNTYPPVLRLLQLSPLSRKNTLPFRLGGFPRCGEGCGTNSKVHIGRSKPPSRHRVRRTHAGKKPDSRETQKKEKGPGIWETHKASPPELSKQTGKAGRAKPGMRAVSWGPEDQVLERWLWGAWAA